MSKKNKFITNEKDKEQYFYNFLKEKLTKNNLINEKYNTFLIIYACFKMNFNLIAFTSFYPIDSITKKHFIILEKYCDHILKYYLDCDESIIDIEESTRKTNESKYDILIDEIEEELLLEILRNQKEDLIKIMLDYKKYE